jgi:hypothetical protein
MVGELLNGCATSKLTTLYDRLKDHPVFVLADPLAGREHFGRVPQLLRPISNESFAQCIFFDVYPRVAADYIAEMQKLSVPPSVGPVAGESPCLVSAAYDQVICRETRRQIFSDQFAETSVRSFIEFAAGRGTISHYGGIQHDGKETVLREQRRRMIVSVYESAQALEAVRKCVEGTLGVTDFGGRF